MNKSSIEGKIKEIYDVCYKIEVEILEGGFMPVKKNPTDAGFDLIATSDISVLPGELIKHPLNLRLKLPEGTYAEITTKSGLGAKGLLVYAGIIDQEYRGVPHVLATNLDHVNGNPISIKRGDKLAQMLVHPYSPNYYLLYVDKVDTDTARGTGGFGSQGK